MIKNQVIYYAIDDDAIIAGTGHVRVELESIGVDDSRSQEFRRAVAEMRVGVPRNDALRSMADRTGVDDLRTLVAVLVQSSQLGVSIAHVLHTQAEQMRVRRRQRAEELARQASVKMVFPLVFLIFPAMYVVVLGPAIPGLLNLFRGISGGG